MLYITNNESGLYFSKLKMLPQGDTLCIVVYKKPIIVQKSTATFAWKIKLNRTFKNIKSGDKIIPIESLKEPPHFNYTIKEIHPKNFHVHSGKK